MPRAKSARNANRRGYSGLITMIKLQPRRSCWHAARKLADPYSSADAKPVESVEMISQSNCRGILEVWGCHLQRMRWNQRHYQTRLLPATKLLSALQKQSGRIRTRRICFGR